MEMWECRPTYTAWAGIKLPDAIGPITGYVCESKSWELQNERFCAGGLCRPLFLEVIMDIEIKDTPYNDRYCGNCTHCIKTQLRYCLKNHAFVAKNKWCEEWSAEDRKSKFEN